MISDLGIIILAGGTSSRMGEDKTKLPWGSTTLLGDMLRKAALTDCGEIMVAINRELEESEQRIVEEAQSFGKQIELVPDQEHRKGLVQALHGALEVGEKEAYIVVSADMPWFSFHWLTEWEIHIDTFLQGDLMAMVPYVGLQEYEPLAAIYKSSIHTLLGESIERQVSLEDILDEVPYMEMDMIEEAEMYERINTPLSYKLAQAKSLNRERSVPIVTISAAMSKTGKTTLLTSLIEVLSKQGVLVGMVKSDSDGCSMDNEGSDTWKASQAGAKSVAVAGPNGYAMIVHDERMNRQQDLVRLANEMPVDLVLIESRTHGVAPIIEVVGSSQGHSRLHQVKDIIAVVTDQEERLEGSALCEQFSFQEEDIERLASWIMTKLI